MELDSIIECSYDGIYITDGEANTIKVNNAYERITGLKKERCFRKEYERLSRWKVLSLSLPLFWY